MNLRIAVGGLLALAMLASAKTQQETGVHTLTPTELEATKACADFSPAFDFTYSAQKEAKLPSRVKYLIGDEDLADAYMALTDLSSAESSSIHYDLNLLAHRIESECRTRLLLESRVNSLERQVATLQKQLSNRK